MTCDICDKKIERTVFEISSYIMCEDCYKENDFVKENTKKTTKPKTTKPKKKYLTEKQFQKICKDAGKDWEKDNQTEELTLDEVAYDMAESMYYDQDIRNHVINKFRHYGENPTKSKIVQMIADYIVG
jgi:ribosome-binding protein aMBF1 (putative translation factor)